MKLPQENIDVNTRKKPSHSNSHAYALSLYELKILLCV